MIIPGSVRLVIHELRIRRHRSSRRQAVLQRDLRRIASHQIVHVSVMRSSGAVFVDPIAGVLVDDVVGYESIVGGNAARAVASANSDASVTREHRVVDDGRIRCRMPHLNAPGRDREHDVVGRDAARVGR